MKQFIAPHISQRALVASALLATVLSPWSVFGQTLVESEFRLSAPASLVDRAITNALPQHAISQSQHWSTLTVATSLLPATLSAVDAKLSFALTSTPLQSGRLWRVSTAGLTAQVQIASLESHGTIQQTVAGAVVSVRVDAVCSDIQMQLNTGSFDFTTALNLAAPGAAMTKSQFSVVGVATHIDPSAWVVTIGSCQGPSGLAQLVSQSLSQALSNSPTLTAALNSAVVGQMVPAQTKLISLMQPQALPIGNAAVGATLLPEQVQSNSDGSLAISGHIRALVQAPSFANSAGASHTGGATAPAASSATTMPIAFSTNDAWITDSDQACFTVPIAFTARLAQAMADAQVLSGDWAPSSVAGFSSFMNNSLAKLFVWPDLLRYSAKTPMLLNIALSSPTLDWATLNKNDIATAASSGASLLPARVAISGQSQTRLLLLSQSQRQLISASNPTLSSTLAAAPYVSFAGPTIVDLTVSAANGAIVATVASVPRLKLHSTFDPLYVQKNHPNTYIANSTIAGQIKKSFAGQSFTVATPFHASHVFRSGEQLLIEGSL